MQRKIMTTACCALLLAACNRNGNAAAPPPAKADAQPVVPSAAASASAFAITEIASFDEPWAMSFLPDGRILVTQKAGTLKLVSPGGLVGDVSGVPEVAYGGQGGLGDIVVHPDFANNGLVFLSYAEKGEGDSKGAAVARARLELDAGGGGRLSELAVIWRQDPKQQGAGHYGHRIAFGPDQKLWIASGERQAMEPAQDMAGNLGKVVRLNQDGTVPSDNPFATRNDAGAQTWSLGHRNLLGFAFDAEGRPWVAEMGPKGGDEFNLVISGRNYGWPKASNGDHYDGRDIPDHSTAPQYEAPKVTWTPVIAPSSLIFYSGSEFPEWQGDALIGGLVAQALVRVEIDGDGAREAQRYDMGKRIREVEQGPQGEVWVLEDGPGARLLKLNKPG